jgi:hypothetical protein
VEQHAQVCPLTAPGGVRPQDFAEAVPAQPAVAGKGQSREQFEPATARHGLDGAVPGALGTAEQPESQFGRGGRRCRALRAGIRTETTSQHQTAASASAGQALGVPSAGGGPPGG